MQTSFRCGIFLVVAATFLAAQTQAQPRFTFDTTPGPLGKDVVPSEYRLALDLHPAKETFAGVVDISLKVRRPVDAIVLNAFGLTAGDIALTGPGGARPMTATDDTTKRQWRIADGRTIDHERLSHLSVRAGRRVRQHRGDRVCRGHDQRARVLTQGLAPRPDDRGAVVVLAADPDGFRIPLCAPLLPR
jgi:hypothetical protein